MRGDVAVGSNQTLGRGLNLEFRWPATRDTALDVLVTMKDVIAKRRRRGR
jgi:hypothetical protein